MKCKRTVLWNCLSVSKKLFVGADDHIGPFVNVAKSIEIWVKSSDFTHGPV